jgi:hypothetical protein
MVRRGISPKRNVADPGSIPGASKGEVAESEAGGKISRDTPVDAPTEAEKHG